MRLSLIFVALLSASLVDCFTHYNKFNSIERQFESVAEYAIHDGFSDFEKRFSEFKLKYNKIYESKNEEEFRKFNFLNTLKEIERNRQLYSKGEVLNKMEINHLADLSENEYRLLMNGSPFDLKSISIEEEEVPQSDEEIPERFDWRERGCVTSVKDQGNCGSCWAFASAASIESAHAIKYNLSLDLSTQELVDCSSVGKYHSNGCNGADIGQAFQYVIDNGVFEDKVYPYVHKQNQCQASEIKSSHKKWFINKYKVLRFNATDEEIMSTIYNNGPVTVLINAEGNDFRSYRSGIITGGPKGYNHYVLVIGWGIENNTKYWIIKNSYSPNWGENGFAKFKREVNIRSLNDIVVYPIL